MSIHPLNLFFDHIFCINLVDNKERRKQAEANFARIGIDVEFFTSVKYPFLNQMVKVYIENKYSGHDFDFEGEVGCSISHYSIIKIAKDRGYKNILIFEDDVNFIKDFNTLLPEYLELVPKDWDMLYLYSGLWRWCYNHYWVENAEGKIFTTYDVTGNIAYAISDKMYDEFLARQDACFQICDNYCNRLQKTCKFKIYSFVPNLCAQYVNKSNINPDPDAIINVFPYMVSFMGKKESDYE